MSLWRDAARLGADCRRGGVVVPVINMLIAQVALHHGATVVTRDRHFLAVQAVAPLAVEFVGPAPPGEA